MATPPFPTPNYLLSHPAPHVLLITINRPKAMNSLSYASQWEADRILNWVDEEASLAVTVITGSGDRAFCAGQDLIEQRELAIARAKGTEPPAALTRHPRSGFAGISRRGGKKPVIAAVNGFALGGGFEIVLGCDMVVASPRATFGLPEVSRGLYAGAGGLSRIVRLCGRPVASEIAMAGRTLSAPEAVKYHIINKVAKSHETTVKEAVELASRIADLSPDAIVVTRSGLLESLEQGSVERATQITDERFGVKLGQGENLAEGLAAFQEKRKPKWMASKL